MEPEKGLHTARVAELRPKVDTFITFLIILLISLRCPRIHLCVLVLHSGHAPESPNAVGAFFQLPWRTRLAQLLRSTRLAELPRST